MKASSSNGCAASDCELVGLERADRVVEAGQGHAARVVVQRGDDGRQVVQRVGHRTAEEARVQVGAWPR